MTESIKRAVRTFCQAFLGTLIASGVLSAASESGVVDWSSLKKIGIAAAISGFIALITFVQNALEETGTVKPFLLTSSSNGPTDL